MDNDDSLRARMARSEIARNLDNIRQLEPFHPKLQEFDPLYDERKLAELQGRGSGTAPLVQPGKSPGRVTDHAEKAASADSENTLPKKAEVSYSPSQLSDMAGISDGTVNNYAKAASVPTPGRGKRNHRYTLSQAKKIFRAIIDKTSDGATRDKCSAALNRLENPK